MQTLPHGRGQRRLGSGNRAVEFGTLYPSTGRIANQLQTLNHIGVFGTPDASLPAPIEDLPAMSSLTDTHVPVALRGKSYLHSNCSICHRPGGPTQAEWTSDSRPSRSTRTLQYQSRSGDLGVPGAQIIAPGSPDLSVVVLRDGMRDPLRRCRR